MPVGRMPGRLVVYVVEGRSFDVGAKISTEIGSAIEKVAHLVQSEVETWGALWEP